MKGSLVEGFEANVVAVVAVVAGEGSSGAGLFPKANEVAGADDAVIAGAADVVVVVEEAAFDLA